MKRKCKAGMTSVMMPIFVRDTSSGTGAGLGSVVFNSSGLVGEYRRQGQSTWTAITLVAGTLGTWSSGGWIADGALTGAYEVGAPDAAMASGARWVAIRYRGVANMLPVLIEIELDAVDYQDATAFGLGNLDAAVSSRSTYAGADTAGTTTLLSRLSSTRAGLLDNLDAAITTRSTYAGADTAGTTTLLSRLSATRATNLDNLDAAVSTRSTYAGADTAGTTTLLSRLSAGRATNLDNLDAAISTRSTYAGADTAGTTTLLTRLGTPTGASIAADLVTISAFVDTIESRIPAALVGGRMDASVGAMATDAISAASVSSAAVTKIQAGLSTYAGGDTAGTTTLLARLTAIRAGLLDNLDAAITTRSTYAGGDTAGTTTLLGRLTSGRATNLDNLDAAITTRLATSGYTAPPSAAAIATAIFTDATSSSDFTSAGSFGKLVVTNIDAPISSVSGGGGSDTPGTTTLLSRLTSGRAGNLDNLDAAVSSRLATSGYAAPPAAATIAWLVFDVVAADHLTPGTTGAALNAAGVAGDPMTAVVPGSYAPGTAGFIIGTNVGGIVTDVDGVMIEPGLNLRQAISIIAAEAAGVGGPSSGLYRGAGVATTRISYTASAGNRTAVTLNPPA